MNRTAPSLLAALELTAITLTTTPLAAQQPEVPAPMAPPVAPSRALVLENFSPFELGTIALGTGGAIFLIGYGDHVFGPVEPGMGAPSTESVDWRFSHWANPNPDPQKQWLGGAPDLGGYLLPVFTLGGYIVGSAGNAFNDDFFMGDTTHELIAFTEAFSWSMVAVNTLKLMVGRTRPFVVRPDIDTDAVGEPEKEHYISFPSGHSASAAATTTFLALDLSDHLVHHTFAQSPAVIRYGVGYGLPMLSAAGITWTVMYSRIRDQRHWLSDTVTGALIGTSFATLFYVMHFDERGEPRKRREARRESKNTLIIQDSYMSPSFTTAGSMLTYGFSF